MPIHVFCPNCKSTIRCPDSSAGKRVKCPTCGTIFTVTVSAAPRTPIPVDASPPVAPPPCTPPSAQAETQATKQSSPAAGLGFTPKRAKSSSWPGYVMGFAALMAFWLGAIFLYYGPRLKPGETLAPSGWGMALSIGIFFAVAEAVNRARRYRAKTESEEPPVADSSVKQGSVAPMLVPVGRGTVKRTAGKIVNGRLVLPPAEMEAIIKEPAAFNNVITVEEHSANVSGINRKWSIVLAKNQAVAFSWDKAETWTVLPSGLPDYKARATFAFELQSTDGSLQPVAVDDPLEAAALRAWRCETWQQFQSESQNPRLPKGYLHAWALMGFFLKTGKDIAPYLQFAPPYGTLEEGLSLLCSKPTEFATILTFVSPKQAAKQLDVVPVNCRDAFVHAIQSQACTRARKYLIGGIVCAAIGGLAGCGALAAIATNRSRIYLTSGGGGVRLGA